MFTKTPSTDPRYPDQETQKIVEDLEKQGVQVPFKDKVHAPAPQDDDDENEDSEDDIEGEDAEKDNEDVEKADQDDVEKKDDVDPADRKDRHQTLIPVGQVKKEKKELERAIRGELDEKINLLTKEIETLKTQKSDSPEAIQTGKDIAKQTDKLQTWIKSLGDNHGMDPQLAQDLLSGVRDIMSEQLDGSRVPEEVLRGLESIKAKEKELEEEKTIIKQNNEFDTEFTNDIAQNKDIRDALQSSGVSIEEFYEKLYEFVFSETGVRYRNNTLSEIFILRKNDLLPTRKKSAESSRGGSTAGENSDPNRALSADELNAMSPQEFQEYSDRMAKNSKHRITRRGKVI